MPLSRSRETLTVPGVNTNLGEEINKQRESQRDTSEFNKELARTDTSFDPTKQAADKAGFAAAMNEYTEWLKGEDQRLKDVTSISLDQKSGKITINAPKIVFNSDAISKNYDVALKTISRMYRSDPKQKFALLQDSNENKTAEDWVKDIEKNLKDDVPRIVARENIKQEHLDNAGVKLTDEDLVKMNTAAVEYNDENGQVVKVSGNTLQVIPDSLMTLPAFKNLESKRDSDSHTVKWKDLSEVWNRDNTSDEDILEVYNAVEKYFKDKDFSDPTEYAEMTAMATFLRQQDPSVNFWRGTGEVLGNAIAGIFSGAATFDVGVMSAVEGGMNWLGNMGQTIFAAEQGADWGKAWEQSQKDDQTFVRDYLAPELESWTEQRHKDLSNLNEAAAASFSITNTLTPIGMQLATVVAAGNAASAYAETAVGKVVTSIAAKYGETASSLATVTVSNIANGAISFEEISKGLYAGTEIMLTLADAATAASTAAKAISTVKSISYAAGAVAKISDIAAQAVVDVTLTDPKLFRQLLETDDEDAKAYAMEQLAQNVAGELGGIAVGKAITGFSKTDVGRILNVKASGVINSLKANVGEASDRLKIAIFHGGNENWLIDKKDKLAEAAKKNADTWMSAISSNRASRAERRLQNYTERTILRRASAMSAEAAAKVGGDSWDDIVKSAKSAQKEMRNITANANNLVNLMYKGDITAETAKILADDSVLTATRGAYIDTLSTVIKAEDAEGLGKGLHKIKDEFGKTVRVISKETNEYVNALYRERVALAEIDLSDIAENVKGAQEELPHLRQIIEDFESSHSDELIQAAQELEKKGREFSAAVQDARVRLGVMSEDTLNGIRASGFFDDGYMRQQRLKNWANYKKSGGQLKVAEIRDIHQKLGWGSTDEWQDITLVLFDDLNEMTRQVVRKKMTDTLQFLGFKMDVIVSEDGTRIVEEISPIRQKAMSAISKNANTFVKNMDDSILNDIYDYNKKSTALRNQQITAISSGADVAKAKAKDYKASDRTVRKMLSEINDSEFARDALEFHLGKSLRDLSAEEIEDILQNASARTKKYMRGILVEARDYGAGGALSKSDLMKIKTSDYTRVTGYSRKDAPNWLKPFLSEKNGTPLDEIGQALSPNYMTDAAQGADYIFDDPDSLLRAYEDVLTRPTGTKLDVDSWAEIVGRDGDGVAQNLVLDNYKDIFDNDEIDYRGSVAAIKQREAIQAAETRYADNTKRLRELTDRYDLPNAEQDIIKSADDLIDTAVENNIANEKASRTFNSIADANASADDIAEYVTTKSLVDNKKKLRRQFKNSAKKSFNEQITADINLKYANDPKGKEKALKNVEKISERYANDATDLFEERLVQRYNEATGKLAEQGSDIIDKDDYLAKVDVLNKEISGASKNPNVVKTYGAHGREEYVELSPTVASMFTNMPRPIRRGPFGMIQSAFVRTFRFGTTGGLIPGSLVNQAFRDTGNAIIAGDAWKTNASVKRILTEEFGATVADYMQKDMPDVWETLLQKADGSEQGAIRLAVDREIAIGAANVEPQLERNIYQLGREARIRRNADGVYDASVWDRITDALDSIQARLEVPNTIRETYLRNRVYNNNLLEGIRTGMSMQEAREFAQFMQAEATTNFTRQSYHLATLTQTVPYLGAAINGAKSFWRLYSLDPVGITTRIVGGYVVPIIALTAHSLQNDDDRHVYEQIPEYEKNDHLTFVIDKQIISIPVPQEMSSFITPVQHMVEQMYKANDNSFAELMANDLLGSFPIDLSGFVNIDSDKILKDNLVEDHLLPGFSRIASSVMPPLIKSGFMMATGIDPYTGRKINTADQSVDSETGERIVYDYKSGALARAIGAAAGDLISAQMAQKVLQSLFGTGGMTIIDSLGEVVDAVVDDSEDTTLGAGLSKGGQKLLENATSKVTVTRYGEESIFAWNRATRELAARRNALVNDKSYKEDVGALNDSSLSEEARKKIESRVRTRRQEYMQQVLDATNNLINRYGGTFDRYKLMTVVSLLNLEEDVNNELPYNTYASYLSDEDKDLNLAAATETMINMGFPSTNDYSLFGYYHTDTNTGKVTIKYNSPLAILNFNRNRWQQDDIDKANLTEIIEENGITRKEMFGDNYQKIKSSGNKAALKKYKSDWNKKVVKALAPYIQNRGVNSFINSHSNQTILKDYIFISNPYKAKEYLLKVFGGK